MTRILALIGDLFACLASFGFVGAASLYLISTVTSIELSIDSGGWVTRVVLGVWFLSWFWVPVALFGRTLAMAVAGLAVVRRDGGVANARRSFVRAIVIPVSVAILMLGLLGIVLGRERRALHDFVAGTTVVYDWGTRQAEQPVTIREKMSARVRRRHGPVGGG